MFDCLVKLKGTYSVIAIIKIILKMFKKSVCTFVPKFKIFFRLFYSLFKGELPRFPLI